MDCSGAMPSTDSLGPVMPRSEMYPVPRGKTRASEVWTCVCVPHTGGDAAHRETSPWRLFARRLGVHINEHHARLIFREQRVHRRERVIGVRIERKPPQKIDDADGAERRCIRRVAPAGTLRGVIRRAQDARLLVEIRLQLPARPCMVAERHNVRSGGENGVRLRRA